MNLTPEQKIMRNLACEKYAKKNGDKCIGAKLNGKTDADIIRQIEIVKKIGQETTSMYIKRLIREDIERLFSPDY